MTMKRREIHKIHVKYSKVRAWPKAKI